MKARNLTALDRVDYEDTFRQACPAQITLESVLEKFNKASPAWVRALMWVRGILVAPLGLKHQSAPILDRKRQLREGDAIGFITVGPITENSIIFGADDKHLDFRASLSIENSMLSCRTSVKFHSNLGKIYFAFVKPFHRIIVPSMLKNMMSDIDREMIKAQKTFQTSQHVSAQSR